MAETEERPYHIQAVYDLKENYSLAIFDLLSGSAAGSLLK
jgi:hypothetical protein